MSLAANGSGSRSEDEDLAALLRDVSRRVDVAARSAATPAESADLRRRLVAATGAARRDAALARRRLLALAADLDRSAAAPPSD
jgi:hypothetical protein